VLVELDGVRLLTDPVVRQRAGVLVRTASPVEPSLLDGIDAVLISHLHADHTDLPSLRGLDCPLVIAPRGAGHWLGKRVGCAVREISVGEEVAVGNVRIGATPALHDPRRWPLGVRAQPIGYVIAGEGGSAYFAGDTDLFPAMAELAGSVDLALLPVAGWGATLGPGHLDPVRAAEAAARIAPRVAIPIHWGTLAPMWPIKRHPDPGAPPLDFAAHAARLAPDVDIRVIEPGERTLVE
jgi:L-ascorbate metabolism protein UlaG (beta-lactamase superfamily)